MWERKSLKANAKSLLKINYWKVVAASLVLLICTNALTISSFSSASDQTDDEVLIAELHAMEPEVVLAAILMILSVVAIACFIAFLISVFVGYPLETGAQKLLINARDGKAEYRDIIYVFKHSYLNVVKALFLRWLFIRLWSILFVIPGIIKSYEYRMVPYLLAEDPQMSSKEAFDKSKEMMHGNKWDAFILDLSFIGWHLLGGCTFCIVEIFFAAPYHYLANAELYHELKK